MEIVSKVDSLTDKNATLLNDISILESLLKKYAETEERDEETKHIAQLDEKEIYINSVLQNYSINLELTEEQEQLIGEWEWELTEHWNRQVITSNTPIEGPLDTPPFSINERIKSILSDDQAQEFQLQLTQIENARTESQAIEQLGRYPASIHLTEEQKDHIYQNIYKYIHADTREVHLKEFNETYGNQELGLGIIGERMLRASNGVLTKKQEKALIHSLIRTQKFLPAPL